MGLLFFPPARLGPPSASDWCVSSRRRPLASLPSRNARRVSPSHALPHRTASFHGASPSPTSDRPRWTSPIAGPPLSAGLVSLKRQPPVDLALCSTPFFPPEKLMTHRVRVMQLYRHILKDIRNWVFSQDVWMKEASLLRAQFDACKHVSDPALVETLIARAEKNLGEWRHPNPYIVPHMFGGSLYARNPPVPKEIKIQMDFGQEE
uniref:NADH dehydrogenase [ubiquinone] 1 beta subcomplex subunit 9 n=1 Tax=Tetraselmis sp. GSL018 TaxID=582737 RepID=A0A061RMM1_9CHLO